MNESTIQEALCYYYDHIYQLTNSYVFPWESDYFGMTKKTGYVYEIEIKVSRADFLNDFKNKNVKHFQLNNPKKEYLTIPGKEMFRTARTNKMEIRRRGIATNVYETVTMGYCSVSFRNNIIPNRFYYAVPKELVEKVINDIPKYAGLISVDKGLVYEIKKAPLLHKRNLLPRLGGVLLGKFYHKTLAQNMTIRSQKRALEEREYYQDYNFEKKVEQLNLF